LRAEGWFDGPDRVLPVAAYELDCRAAVDSVVYGHAGFVPDYYLADLGPEAAVSAADLVAAGLWGRAEGGYRWLDQEVVDFLQERQRESDEEAARARAREKEEEDEGLAELAEAMEAAPPCAVCGTPSARVELVAPGGFPAEWERWPGTVRDTFLHREPGQWYLLFTGVAAYNGYGDPIEASRAGRIARAFRPPLSFAQVRTAGFYDDAGFCQDCDAPYCYRHWHVSESGYGSYPRGHGKSLDPHWSPW
jgi:hypothetical protein